MRATRAFPRAVLTDDFLAAQDGVLIVTDHSAFNYEWIVQHAALVVDTRNATAAIASKARGRIVKA
jgi:UDP-N-acetyl-D-glucosamine dehydrogenase